VSIEPPDNEEDEDARQRTNYIVLVVAALIVVIGLLLLKWMNGYMEQERCRIEGRRDCDPIEVPQQ
jgi:hypothetical protein